MQSLRNYSGSSGEELLEALQVRKHQRKRHKAKTSNVSARLNPNFDAKAVAQNFSTTDDNHDKPASWAATTQSIASRLKDMSLMDRQEITASFKISMLNSTLRFMKDPAQLTLAYPEMSLIKASFLFNMIDPSKSRQSDLGSGFKSLYSSLYETMHKLEENIEFKLSFASSSNLETAKLVLTKILKNQQVDAKNAGGDNSNNLNTSISSSTSSTSSKHSTKLSKAEKDLLSKQEIVNSLPESFLRSTLEKFFNFIKDKLMASLVFKNVNVAESRFLECLIGTSNASFTSPRSEDFCSLFSAPCVVLLKRIRRALRREDWAIRIDVGKLSRLTETRLITFYKTPCYGTKNATRDSTAEHLKESIKAANFAKAFNIPVKYSSANKDEIDGFTNKMASDITAPKLAQCDKESRPVFPEIKALRPIRPEIKEVRSSEAGNEKCKLITKEHSIDSEEKGDLQKKLPQAAMSFQSAGSLSMAPVSPPPGSAGAGSGKARLLAALATPVGGGVAERIMRQSMGWEGGALGTRGEGIVEPIMPAIHLKPGAGLGHVQAPPATGVPVVGMPVTGMPTVAFHIKLLSTLLSGGSSAIYKPGAGLGHVTAPPATGMPVVAFRVKLLTALLSLLRSSATETSVSFPQPATKKHYRFFKDVLRSFNCRRTPGWSGPELDLVNEISAEMMRNRDFQINFEISKDMKVFFLQKGPIQIAMPKEKPNSLQKKTNTVKITAPNDDVTGTADEIESLCPSRKSAETLAYKIMLLHKIKEFFMSEKESDEFTFDSIINKKTQTYLNTIITKTNKGSLIKMYSAMETDILKDILKFSKDWFTTIAFCNKTRKSFKMKKKLLSLNKINTDNEKCIPKSTDLKNTIIYVNNEVVSAEKYKELNNKTTKGDKITDHSNITEDMTKGVQSIDDCTTNTNLGHCKNADNDDITIRDENVNASDFKALINDSQRENNVVQNNENTTDLAFQESSNSDLTNDVAKDGCDKNVLNESMIIASDEDSKFILPDTDESDFNISRNTDKDLESDLESTKAGKLDDASKEAVKGVNDVLTFPLTDDSVVNETDNYFESSLDDIDISDIFKGGDNVKTKSSNYDTDYDNFKLNLHGEVNNNHDIDKDRNQTDKNVDEYLNNSSPRTHNRSSKKSNFVKYVRIISKDRKEIGKDSVKFIQKLILEVIDENVFLPLLKCHGIHDGALIYSCHNEDSYDWLNTVMNIVSDVVMKDLNFSENSYKMSFKIASYIDEEAATVFNRLQIYNPGLSTDKWKVMDKQKNEDFVKFQVRVDRNSFRFISEKCFSLFVGIDKAQFSIMWD